MNEVDSWLNKTQEEAIEPELPICDPHHHLWDYEGSRYLLDQLLADIGGGHNVRSTVFVECSSMYRKDGPAAMRPVGETEFVQGIAAMSASGGYGECRVAAGIVGFADLTLGAAVDDVLEAHLIAGHGRFRGIRHACSWHDSDEIRNSHTNPPPALLMDDSFRQGVARLEKYDLSFEAWLYHTQLEELLDLARAFPGTSIILNHVGGPLGIGPHRGRQSEIFDGWARNIEALAGCPNIVVKLGGIAMPLNGFDWHKRDQPPSSKELATSQAPYYLHCIEHFGAERAMFESNFPVDRRSTSYTVLWNGFKRVAAGGSDVEKAALFHDTAARIYRIGTG